MKTIFTLCLLLFCFHAAKAQLPHFVSCKKETAPNCSIDADRAYACIINTDGEETMKSLIRKSQRFFIEEELVSASELEVIDFDENLSEYTVKFGFRKGMHYGPAQMGLKMPKSPVRLFFDAVFSFNNEGQIKITFTNFRELTFVMVNMDKGIIDIYYQNAEIKEAVTVMMTTESFMGRMVIWANSDRPKEVVEQLREEYREDLAKEYEMYSRVVATGEAMWLSDQEIAELKYPGNKYFTETAKKFVESNKLLSVDNETWENYFEKNFNFIFKEIANLVNGEIEAVALDGNVKFVSVDGEVLPSDLKLRKKWEKQGTKF